MGEEEREERPVVPGYLAPRDDEEVRRREYGRTFAGAVLAAGAVLGLVFVWIISNIRIDPAPPGSTPPPVEYKGPGLITLTTVVVIGGIGVWYWKREGSKAFLIGSVIGLGIGALIEGVCFAVNMSR